MSVLNETFFNEFTIRVPGDAARRDRAAGAQRRARRRAVLAARRRAIPDLADLIVVASTEVNTDEDRAAYAKALAEVLSMLNRQGRPTAAGRSRVRTHRETFTGNRGLQHRGGADLRDRPHRR